VDLGILVVITIVEVFGTPLTIETFTVVDSCSSYSTPLLVVNLAEVVSEVDVLEGVGVIGSEAEVEVLLVVSAFSEVVDGVGIKEVEDFKVDDMETLVDGKVNSDRVLDVSTIDGSVLVEFNPKVVATPIVKIDINFIAMD